VKWTHNIPTEEGLYLRNNPVVKSVVREQVIIIEGQPYMINEAIVKITEKYSKWWWYGPIPLVPNE